MKTAGASDRFTSVNAVILALVHVRRTKHAKKGRQARPRSLPSCGGADIAPNSPTRVLQGRKKWIEQLSRSSNGRGRAKSDGASRADEKDGYIVLRAHSQTRESGTFYAVHKARVSVTGRLHARVRREQVLRQGAVLKLPYVRARRPSKAADADPQGPCDVVGENSVPVRTHRNRRDRIARSFPARIVGC